MADGNSSANAVIIDQSLPDPRVNTPQMQDSAIQEIDRQAYTIYHFHNCGTVYLDSLNAHNVTMENCGNNVPQVTYYRPRIVDCERSEKILHSQRHDRVSNEPLPSTVPPRTGRTDILFSASLVAVSCLAFFIMYLPRLCGIVEKMGAASL